MIKRFGNYQYVPTEPMSGRDKQEENSKFWNEGKWETFILPFINENVNDMTLVDMGSNAGLFLKIAEDMGFKRVVGVEANKEAFDRALEYKEQTGGSYNMHRTMMENSIGILPVADYTILANIHYYLNIGDWLKYLDELITKTRYCIIVTCEKERYRGKIWKGSCFVPNIRNDFKVWDEVGIIDDVSMDDPYPRKGMKSLCFKSPYIERVKMDEIDNPLDVCGFYADVEAGKDPHETEHAKNLLTNSKRKHWSEKRFDKYLKRKVNIFEDIKENGLKSPIIINSDNRVCDGRNRFEAMKHLGYNSVLVRRVL